MNTPSHYDIQGIHRGNCGAANCQCSEFVSFALIKCEICGHPPTFHDRVEDEDLLPCSIDGCECRNLHTRDGETCDYCSHNREDHGESDATDSDDGVEDIVYRRGHSQLAENLGGSSEHGNEDPTTSASTDDDEDGDSIYHDVEDVESIPEVEESKCPICSAPESLFPSQEKFEAHVDSCLRLSLDAESMDEVEQIQNSTQSSMTEVIAVYRVSPRKIPHNAFTRNSEIEDTLREGIELREWLNRAPEEEEYYCPISMTYHPFGYVHVVGGCGHIFCLDCLRQHARIKIEENNVVLCPGRNDRGQACRVQLDTNEVSEIFGTGDPLVKIYEDILFQYACSEMSDFFLCPTEGCTFGVAVADRYERYPIRCSQCEFTFCHLCNRAYHYRCTCEEAIRHAQSWMAWNGHGRREYLSAKNKFQEYGSHVEQLEKRNQEVQARFNDLFADERWKENHCRLCPHCNRAVQKLEGCDSMVCGRDTDGGNIQSGCGGTFSWGTTEPYKSVIPPRANLEALRMEKPPDPCTYRHGEWKCAECGDEIVGLRFSCVQCEAYDLCEDCEARASHPADHVFRIMNKSI